MELIWNEQNQNAVVHEVRSDSPEITLPETVEGRKIVAVGAETKRNKSKWHYDSEWGAV